MKRFQKLFKKNMGKTITIIAVGFSIALGIFFYYSNRIQSQLVKVGSENIEETYREVAQLYNEISKSRWNYLKLLGHYFDEASIGDEEYQNVVDEYKETLGFTEFYLMNSSGEYYTIHHESGYIDLGTSLNSVIKDGNQAIVDGSLPTKENMIFYVVKVESNTYDGFQYDMMAFGYNSLDMGSLLEVNAYDQTSYPYVVYRTGKITIRSTKDENTDVANIFTMLKRTNITESELEAVQNGIANLETGTILMSTDQGDYYFSYQPLITQDWMLVSFTPASAVNNSIDIIRGQTTSMLSVGLGSIFALLIFLVIIVFSKNIKEKTEMIAQRDAVFTLISNDLDEIYILFDYQTMEVEYISPNVERLLGISEEQIYKNAKNLTSTWADRNDETVYDVLGKVKKGKSVEKEIYLNNKKTKKDTLYSLTVFKSQDVEQDDGVAVVSDRTKERKIRQEIEDALQSAMVANEAKTSFLSNMSHDIRTPMNAIVGFSTLAEKDIEDKEKTRNYIRKIQDSSKHLLSLINDVLDFSKIEAGKTTLKLEPLNIEKIVGRLDSMLRPQTITRNLNLNYEFLCGIPCIVEVDELRLTQVLVNILSNAIKYTPDGGTIDFHVTNEQIGQMIKYTFVVADTGVGMSQEFVETIFEPFSREEKSVTNKVQGTGLGMAITKNIVDLMGGTINVESEKDVGSTFTVEIAFRLVELLEEGVTEIETEGEKDVSIKGLHILAAEDNALNAEIIEELLKLEGCSVDIVTDGQQCVQAFEEHPEGTYDVILMDVQMPNMNGYEATKAIRASEKKDAKTISIIAMTANAFLEDKKDALASGMNAHVAKPIDMKTLKRTIHGVLSGGLSITTKSSQGMQSKETITNLLDRM